MTGQQQDNLDELYSDFFEDDDEVGSKPATESTQPTEGITPEEVEHLIVSKTPEVEAWRERTLRENQKHWDLSDDESAATPKDGSTRSTSSNNGLAVRPTRPPLQRASRFRLMPEDYALMEFLESARYATYPQLAKVIGSSEKSAENRANRLFKFGYLERRKVTRFPSLYFLSSEGQGVVGSDHGLVNTDFGSQLVNHTLRVNDLAAGLLSHEKKPSLVFERELQHAAFSENYIRRKSQSGEMQAWQDMRHEKNRAVAAFLDGRSNTPPESHPDGEWLWAIYEGIEQHYHFPDLVITTPRRRDRKPTAQAVEVELSRKKPKEVMRVLRAYKREFQEGGVYDRVIWWAGSEAVERLILRCAKAPTVMFPMDRIVVGVIGRD